MTPASLDPLRLFPWLALLFLVLAVRARIQRRDWQGAARTWLLLALMFAAVAAWLGFAR